MTIKMVRGLAGYASLKGQAKYYDLLTSEGSLVLEIGERHADDALNFERGAFAPCGDFRRIATITNSSGEYSLIIQGNHRGDAYSEGAWHTWFLRRTA